MAGGTSTGDGLAPPSSLARDLVAAKELEYLTDGAFRTRGFWQRQVVLDLVAIASPIALLEHIAGVGEISDDPEGRALRDPQRRRDVTQTNAGIPRDAQQHPRVVGEEAPLRHARHSSYTNLETEGH